MQVTRWDTEGKASILEGLKAMACRVAYFLLCLLNILLYLYQTVTTDQYRMTEESNQVTLMKLRNRAGLTRRQVAAELEVTEKTIYVWETSPNPPRLTVAQVQRLIEILNCSMEELVEATENRPQN